MLIFIPPLGDTQEAMVDVSSDSSSDEDSLTERVKGRKVLATPAVRRIAMENKVVTTYSSLVYLETCL